MPYKVGDKNLPSNVAKMSKKDQKAWIAIFNDTHQTCMSNGGDTASCDTESFKMANGAMKKKKKTPSNSKKMTVENRNILRKLWDGLLDSIVGPIIEDVSVERSIGMGRLREQLWDALDEYMRNMQSGSIADMGGMSSMDYAYPIDIYLGDNGAGVFALVAQSGKLFQVPMTVSNDTLTLGKWTQVTELYKPVTQSRFSVKRQADGTYRWLCIAGTTVLNRVGEIDSSALFDSFIKQAVEHGKYPRLDFYHLGETDPKNWEFGTADYLARDGCCYIASGTFDKGHPLAKAAIKACKNGGGEWGNSIEFYAYAEPEIILLDPKVQVPIYKEGENTRISMVLERDAAGLFTRMIDISDNEEKGRSMNPKIEEVLKKLFGDDEVALKAFVENVDTVNRTVTNDKLIHRAKKDEITDEDSEDEDEEDTEEDESEDIEDTATDEIGEEVAVRSIELDEEGMKHLVQQVSQSKEFSTLLSPLAQSISDLSAVVSELKTGRDTDTKEITRLKKANTKLIEQVKLLSTDENEKKQTWQQDLPARQHTQASYRPRDAHKDEDSEDEDGSEDDFEAIANKTLEGLHTY